MSSSHDHPRRRYLNGSSSPTQSSSLRIATSPDGCYSLRKSTTFSAPSSPSSDEDPIMSIPALPRRSPTSSSDLENLVAAVDRSLSGLETFATKVDTNAAIRDQPTPRFFLEAHAEDFRESICRPSETALNQPIHRNSRNHHSSDSGIGSSISASDSSMSNCAALRQGMIPLRWASATDLPVFDEAETSSTSPDFSTTGQVTSGINGASASFLTPSQHTLSEYACRQIQKFIIIPILREDCLKEYHTLVRGIPHRVASKEITCLRDLEKVLLWLAPVSLRPHHLHS